MCEELLRARAIALQAQLFFGSQKTLSPSDARAKGDGRAAALALPSQSAFTIRERYKSSRQKARSCLFALPKLLALPASDRERLPPQNTLLKDLHYTQDRRSLPSPTRRVFRGGPTRSHLSPDGAAKTLYLVGGTP